MSATITDHFNKAANGSGTYPVLGKVSAARSTGGTTLTCESLTGWATDTPVHFSTYHLNEDGEVDTATQTDWKGIVSGSTITNLTRIAGAADTGNLIGDIVELNPTIGWLDDVISGLLVSHAQDGTLKSGVVSTTKLANGAVTGAANSATTVGSTKMALATVGTPNLRDGAVTAGKIDWTTMGVCSLKSNASTITPSASGVIPFNLTAFQRGNLTKSDNAILVGAGISVVKVSASIFFERANTNYSWAEIRKNGTAATPRTVADCSGGYGSAVLADYYIDVSEGDLITVVDIEGTNRIRLADSWLTVSAAG